MSEERKKYLQKQKFEKILVLGSQIIVLVTFLGLWETLANKGVIDSFITSSPSRIIKTFANFSANNLFLHIRVTIYETLLGFGIGITIGTIIAIILWWSKFLSKVFEPYLVVLIVMAIAISLIVTILEILNGFLNTDKVLIKMAKTFNANKFQILTKIVIPANISTFINSLKINIGLSLVGVISGEFLISKAGLGYLITYGGQVFKLDLVMSSIIILGIFAGLMYGAVALLEKVILNYGRLNSK